MQTSTCRHTLFWVLFSCSALNTANANEPEKKQLKGKQLEELVVVSNPIANDRNEAPGSVSVINDEQLIALSAVHIQEALRTAPGVNFQRGNGQESLPAIRSAVLTGAGACGSNLTLEQSIPVRAAGFCNVNELFDTHFEQAQQIEILRGPQSAFYGSNGLTGSINVRLPADGKSRLSLELGPDDYIRGKGAFSYGNKNNSNYGRLYLTLSEDGGFRDDSGYEQQKFSWRHVYTNNNLQINAGLTATHLNQETAGFIVGENSYRDENLRTQNLDPNAFRKTDSFRAWSRFTWSLDNDRQLTITPYIRNTDMDFRLHFLPGDPLEKNSQQGIGWQSAFTINNNKRVSWSLGIDGEFSQGDLSQTQDEPTRGSAFLQATIPTGVHYDYKVDSQQLAAFTHLDWDATDKLNLKIGARLENIRYDYDNLALDGRTRDDGTECGFGGCRYSRPADRKDDFTHFSPKLELQYAVNDQFQMRAIWADSSRAPQATELYRLQRAQTVADLDTVTGTTLELGARWQTEYTKLDIALYQLEQRNLIIRDSDFFNVDGTATDSVGLEIYLEHDLSEHWQFRLAYTKADHEYASGDIDGNQIDTAPQDYGSAFIKWTPNQRFWGELEVSNVGDYFLDVDNLFTYEGHTLWHLRGAYQFNQGWTLSTRINNLTDKLYAERADFTSFTGHRYFPGTPRSVFVEVSKKF